MLDRAQLPSEPDRIRGNRLFEGLPPESLSELASDIALLQFEPDEVIFHEGDPGDCLYLVTEGSVRISKIGRGGKQETLDLMREGNFFGEMALIDGLPRSAQAAAAERAVLGRIDQQAFDRILERAPRRLLQNFLRLVVERLRGVNAHYITEIMRAERLSLVGTMANSIIHDLKNPIHCIRSATEILSMKAPAPELSDFYHIINRASDNMLDMIQELLDYARGTSSVQLQRKPAGAVLVELDIQLSQLIPPGVELTREGLNCETPVLVDVGRFARMLLNLVKNSVEAMPGGGMIWLSASEHDSQVSFRVSDTGCGIDPSMQAKIFEPFVTFGKSKGTGLGMAIVKSVVDAHNGKIKLTSQVGVGTSIEITIPKAE